MIFATVANPFGEAWLKVQVGPTALDALDAGRTKVFVIGSQHRCTFNRHIFMVRTNFCISAFHVHNDSQRIKLFLIKRQSVWTRTIIIIKTTRMSAWHQGTQSFVWRLCWRSVHRYKSLTRSGSLAISVVDGSRRGLTSRFTSSNGYRGYTLVYLSCHWQHLMVDHASSIKYLTRSSPISMNCTSKQRTYANFVY